MDHFVTAVRLAAVDTSAVLRFLGLRREAPSLDYLRRVQRAMKTHVPWETASRVVRAASVARLEDRPRRPAEFWQRAMVDGTGGTCFESDYSLWALLEALGFEASLRINDMPREPMERCHAAVVINFDGRPYVVDVGMGNILHEPLPLPSDGDLDELRVRSGHYDYTVRRLGDDRYDLRTASPEALDPGQMYVLVDRPVSIEKYDARVVEDYGDSGLFLDRVTLTRFLPDGSGWRYGADGRLLRFEAGAWHDLGPPEGDHALALARTFRVPHGVLAEAFALVGR